jgi:hypothetical protein
MVSLSVGMFMSVSKKSITATRTLFARIPLVHLPAIVTKVILDQVMNVSTLKSVHWILTTATKTPTVLTLTVVMSVNVKKDIAVTDMSQVHHVLMLTNVRMVLLSVKSLPIVPTLKEVIHVFARRVSGQCQVPVLTSTNVQFQYSTTVIPAAVLPVTTSRDHTAVNVQMDLEVAEPPLIHVPTLLAHVMHSALLVTSSIHSVPTLVKTLSATLIVTKPMIITITRMVTKLTSI